MCIVNKYMNKRTKHVLRNMIILQWHFQKLLDLCLPMFLFQVIVFVKIHMKQKRFRSITLKCMIEKYVLRVKISEKNYFNTHFSSV